MTPKVDPSGLKETKPHEYLLRFVFGGAVTVAAGLVAHYYGPEIGGLFLAFPAILPASMTLVMDHDGRADACKEARGAALGALGLLAFALVVWRTAPFAAPALCLGGALAAWLFAALLLWRVTLGRGRRAG